jgi:tetratricopeptide (TPR) repeat protein
MRNGAWGLASVGFFLILSWPPDPAWGGDAPSPDPQPPAVRSLSEADVVRFRKGLKIKDKARALDQNAARAADAAERGRLERKAAREFERAIGQFRQAVRRNPSFHQAFAELGYALWKRGDPDSAMQAYERALLLEPTYPQTIAYRAETWLALERLEEAKQDYVRLFLNDPSLAESLLAVMKEWLAKHRDAPGKIDPVDVREFSRWVAGREKIARERPAAC